MPETASERKVKLGIVGIGVGASEILPAMEQMPELELVAAADVNPRVLETFRQRYGAKTYDSVDKLCADPDVEAVWVSTPNRFHAPHTIIAANSGKHVVVEKPMAISLQEAEQMIEAATKNKIKLLCGHTQSFGPHIRTMRKIIRSGELGPLCALHVWAYTDWMLRPRTAEELDINQGGGVPYRQGPHQIDTLRLLGGGMVRSVRGATGKWFKGRAIPGYYSAFLEFEDGTPATLMHNGYGYFLASELVPWGGQNSRYSEAERAAIRKSLLDGTRNENADKDQMRIGGAHEREVRDRSKAKPWLPNDLGILIASCEKGDIRQSQYGLFVHSDEGTKDVPLVGGGGPSRRGELMELYNAVVLEKPIRHTGSWGRATLEVCLALMQSARERKEIYLKHQVAAPEED
ncbi:MAG TPA: Gfo/Idh/MocA family oxidoreductase [Candidatus Binatia bacterium]|jgi:predicted dehydrogenase|nr:Gfo/Idh/MocA family oxidoreductase [Candidatus Binatia bacterium]